MCVCMREKERERERRRRDRVCVRGVIREFESIQCWALFLNDIKAFNQMMGKIEGTSFFCLPSCHELKTPVSEAS